MPVMDGAEFRREQLRDALAAQIPTVVMSAVHKMNERIAELGVADAMEKPVTLRRPRHRRSLLPAVNRPAAHAGWGTRPNQLTDAAQKSLQVADGLLDEDDVLGVGVDPPGAKPTTLLEQAVAASNLRAGPSVPSGSS